MKWGKRGRGRPHGLAGVKGTTPRLLETPRVTVGEVGLYNKLQKKHRNARTRQCVNVDMDPPGCKLEEGT